MKKLIIAHTHYKRRALLRSLALLWLAIAPAIAWAQISPDNPPEPYVYYKVAVSTNMPDIAWTSGGGSYLYGTQVWLNTSLYNQNYTFSHWSLDGDTISKSTGFYFTVGAKPVSIVAHYDYTPLSPEEPSLILKNRLALKVEPMGAASFNRTSGEKQVVDSYVWLRAYGNQGYEFQGWYDGETLVSTSEDFNYLMPDRDLTLTARYSYNPANPADPQGGSQTNVKTRIRGDINKDNTVDITDAVAAINSYLDNTTDPDILTLSDLNNDGIIDVTDAVLIINIYLGRDGSR